MSKGKPLHKVFFCEKCYTEGEFVADLPVDEIDLERGGEFNIHKDLGWLLTTTKPLELKE